MIYVQAKLTKDSTEQVAWIEKKKGVKVGARVELKETGEFWEVKALFTEMEGQRLLDNQKMNKSFGSSIK